MLCYILIKIYIYIYIISYHVKVLSGNNVDTGSKCRSAEVDTALLQHCGKQVDHPIIIKLYSSYSQIIVKF